VGVQHWRQCIGEAAPCPGQINEVGAIVEEARLAPDQMQEISEDWANIVGRKRDSIVRCAQDGKEMDPWRSRAHLQLPAQYAFPGVQIAFDCGGMGPCGPPSRHWSAGLCACAGCAREGLRELRISMVLVLSECFHPSGNSSCSSSMPTGPRMEACVQVRAGSDRGAW